MPADEAGIFFLYIEKERALRLYYVSSWGAAYPFGHRAGRSGGWYVGRCWVVRLGCALLLPLSCEEASCRKRRAVVG